MCPNYLTDMPNVLRSAARGFPPYWGNMRIWNLSRV